MHRMPQIQWGKSDNKGKKWARDWDMHFTKGDIQGAKKQENMYNLISYKKCQLKLCCEMMNVPEKQKLK